MQRSVYALTRVGRTAIQMHHLASSVQKLAGDLSLAGLALDENIGQCNKRIKHRCASTLNVLNSRRPWKGAARGWYFLFASASRSKN